MARDKDLLHGRLAREELHREDDEFLLKDILKAIQMMQIMIQSENAHPLSSMDYTLKEGANLVSALCFGKDMYTSIFLPDTKV